MSEIKSKIGNFRFLNTSSGEIALNMSLSNEMSTFFNGSSAQWDGDPVNIAGIRVVPWGVDNNMPMAIRNLLEKITWARASWTAKQGCCMGRDRCFTALKWKIMSGFRNG